MRTKALRSSLRLKAPFCSKDGPIPGDRTSNSEYVVFPNVNMARCYCLACTQTWALCITVMYAACVLVCAIVHKHQCLLQAAQHTHADSNAQPAFVDKGLAGDAERQVQLHSARSCERDVEEMAGSATLGARHTPLQLNFLHAHTAHSP